MLPCYRFLLFTYSTLRRCVIEAYFDPGSRFLPWMRACFIYFAAEQTFDEHTNPVPDYCGGIQQHIHITERVQIARNKECQGIVPPHKSLSVEAEETETDRKYSQKHRHNESAESELHLSFQSSTLHCTHSANLIKHVDIQTDCCRCNYGQEDPHPEHVGTCNAMAVKMKRHFARTIDSDPAHILKTHWNREDEGGSPEAEDTDRNQPFPCPKLEIPFMHESARHLLAHGVYQ